MEPCGSSPRQCYVALTQEHDEKGFWPSLVTEGQPGYHPLSGKGACARPWYWGATLDECQAMCDQMNQEDFGISPEQALKIRLSSFRAADRSTQLEGKPGYWQIMRAMPELTPDQHAELAGPELIEAAREWIADCEWADNIDADELTPGQVQAGITRHYAGGWAQFLRDRH